MDKLLPLGSIIKLQQESTTDLMIIGYYPMDDSKKTMYDYLGTMVPAGILNDRDICLFNSIDIKEVLYNGYCDEEAEKMLKTLPEIMKEVDETSQELENDQEKGKMHDSDSVLDLKME